LAVHWKVHAPTATQLPPSGQSSTGVGAVSGGHGATSSCRVQSGAAMLFDLHDAARPPAQSAATAIAKTVT
jgi:hypothetical protein